LIPSKIDTALVLYTELAQYTVECLNSLVRTNKNIQIHVVKWPINNEAPFIFNFHERIIVTEKVDIDLVSYYNKINPKVIICSGWIDNDYINFIKNLKSKVVKVLAFDNYWENSLKQNLGKFFLKKIISKHFDFCWIPGALHESYANKIGFNDSQIVTGFYARDLQDFNLKFLQNANVKKKKFPKKFLYVGRYLKLKGIIDLWNCFAEFSKDNSDWELHCVGSGDLYNNRLIHHKIFHHGFLQNDELLNLIDEMGVFIMPSHYDHWGMAVQEFASSGFPLICSDKVGSASAFLKEDENGFLFETKNQKSLLTAMHKIANLSDEDLSKFASNSNILAKKYDINTWVTSFMKFFKYD
jgi:glycosyltransferase involved in cell wall biosynthesis